jgi:drug/metabolite transporter (DMT)-like permease
MLPTVFVGACVSGTVAACVIAATGTDFSVPFRDALICVSWGGVVQCTGLALIVASARLLPAAELSLLTIVESVAGPFWTWLIMSETPDAWTIAGGAIVVVVATLWSLDQVGRQRRLAEATRVIPPTAT